MARTWSRTNQEGRKELKELKKSSSADEVKDIGGDVLDKLERESVRCYHPPYEHGADFNDATLVKVNVVPLFMRESRKEQQAQFKAIASLIGQQKHVLLKNLYAFYFKYKGKGKDSQQPETQTLPSLDWNASQLRFRYLLQKNLSFDTKVGANVICPCRKDRASAEDSVVPLSKQWECLRLYMQPLVSIGVAVTKADRKCDILEEASMDVLFDELREHFPALVYNIIVVNECDIVQLLSERQACKKEVVLCTRYHQMLASTMSSAHSLPDFAAEVKCPMNIVMHKVGALLILVMEQWLSKATPASLALTTPLDLLRTTGLGTSSISEHDSVAHMKYSHVGRLRKELGDYCLCIGSPEDALIHYAVALDVTKECEDILWHASALEGTCAVDVCTFFRDFQSKSSWTQNMPKKLEQLWLSIRQACEQAMNLYKGLPTLRTSLLLKVAYFGAQLLAFSPPWSSFSLMTRVQIEKYIEEVVDHLPNLTLIAGEEEAPFCLLDIAKIYKLLGKKKKVAQYLLLAASLLSDRYSDLALHLSVCAGRLYGLDNMSPFRNDELLKEKNICDFWEKRVRAGSECRWPKLIQTVQFGVIANALSQRKQLVAARAAFYFLVVYNASRRSGDDDNFEIDRKTWRWLFRCIYQVEERYLDRKHSVDILKGFEMLVIPDRGEDEDKDKGKDDGVFLYNPFKAAADLAAKQSRFTVTSGQLVQVRVEIANPFPLGLILSARICVEKLEDQSSVFCVTLNHTIKVKAQGRVEGLLHFIPQGKGKVRITGCAFQLGKYSWLCEWKNMPTLLVNDDAVKKANANTEATSNLKGVAFAYTFYVEVEGPSNVDENNNNKNNNNKMLNMKKFLFLHFEKKRSMLRILDDGKVEENGILQSYGVDAKQLEKASAEALALPTRATRVRANETQLEFSLPPRTEFEITSTGGGRQSIAGVTKVYESHAGTHSVLVLGSKAVNVSIKDQQGKLVRMVIRFLDHKNQ